MNKKGLNVLFIIVLIIAIGLLIASMIMLPKTLGGCEHCYKPMVTYEYEGMNSNTPYIMELYLPNITTHTESALEHSTFNGNSKWYLSVDEDDFNDPYILDDDVPPSTITSYYYVEVNYCPWCGKTLN